MRAPFRYLTVVLLFAGAGCSGTDDGDPSVTLQQASFVTLKETLADLKGKVVVLDFWRYD
jgi:hypothetical protein